VNNASCGAFREDTGVNIRLRSAESLRKWFLILTKPGGESLAKCNLERQRYLVYHPRLSRPVLSRGRWIERIVSLFPRYLFVQVDAVEQSLSCVRSTLGVANIVRFGTEPAVVDNAVIDGLMSRADPKSGLHRLAQGLLLERGSSVSIVAGAFEGLEGIFEREAGSERVVVLLSLLGKRTPVCVPARYVFAT
jgi:transcriptional antiterminator RfaH